MPLKKIKLLEWLKQGVLSNIITIKKAKEIYETQYAPVKNFDRLLFEV